jgi:hypothetical protein
MGVNFVDVLAVIELIKLEMMISQNIKTSIDIQGIIKTIIMITMLAIKVLYKIEKQDNKRNRILQKMIFKHYCKVLMK